MARPRKEDALDIAHRAVEQTIRLLEEAGIAGLSMAKVAAAVGCSAPALYNHFRNKEDLLRAAHDAGFERLYATKLAVARDAAGDPLARLRLGGRAYLDFALENPALYALMFSPDAAAALRDNPFQGDLGRKSLDHLTAAVAACQRAGLLPGQEAQTVAFTLWSTVHGAASLMLQNRAPASATDRDRLADALVDTVMAMIAASPPPPPQSDPES